MASKVSGTVLFMIYKMHASWGHHSHTLTCYEVWIAEVTGSACGLRTAAHTVGHF